jgi:serine/threonine-protein kinase
VTEIDGGVSAFSGLPPTPVARIGRYDVIGLLGQGAMGAVLRARDSLLDRDVALKVMLPQIAADPEQKLRFEREARAIARMMHPNVVTIFDLGYHTDGSPYIAMELLRGQDLFHALRSGTPLAMERRLSLILQVLDGVGHAHRVGIVHRDIKPANTFLDEAGGVKIMDFGIARFTAASMTSSGVIVGTANYMAPEQVNGARVDGRADLFSVGCMLYELLIGRLPFEGESLMATLWKIVHEDPTYDGLPAGMSGAEPVLRRALAKSPEARYQEAADFAAGVRSLLVPHPADALVDAGATAAMPSPAVAAVRPPADRVTADPEPLFTHMRGIQVGARSGHLHFTHGHERRSLRVARGAVVHGTSDVPGQQLGGVLVRYGFLTQIDLERATERALQGRRRLGRVLVELGLLDEARVREAVGIHVREIVSEVASRGDGSFVFEELAHEPAEGEAPAYSIGDLILETARRIQSPEVVRRTLGDVDRTVSQSTQPLLRAQRLALTATEGFLLSRIDGTTTAREAMALVPLPLEDVERNLFALLCTGAVEYVEPARPQTGAPRARAAPPPAPPSLEAARREAKLRDAARAAEQRAASVREAIEARQAGELRRREILAAHDGLSRLNLFEVLGVGPSCSTGEVEAAFRRLAMSFHPNVPLDSSLDDLRARREEVYSRQLQAYETLRDLDRRSEYRARLAAGRAPGAADETHEPPVPRPAERQAVSLSADGPLDPVAVLDGIKEAQKLLKQGKTWDSIQLLESIIPRTQGHNRFRAQVLLARAFLKNPKWTKRAEDLLHRVVREAPEHAEAYVVLGHIYRGGDLPTRAIAMYRRALSLHPAHPEAAEALQALDPHGGDGPGGQLLRRILGKGPA